jgi:CBS domain-containing protein
MKIKDLARIKGREVITVKPHATITEVLKYLVINKIGAMPVCDFKGTLLGIISERDIMRWLHRGNMDFEGTQVKDIMTYKVYTTDPEDDMDTVLKTMIAKGFRHMPVMSGSRCVGIFSLRDIIEQQTLNAPERAKTFNEYITVSPDVTRKKPVFRIPSYPGSGPRD